MLHAWKRMEIVQGVGEHEDDKAIDKT